MMNEMFAWSMLVLGAGLLVGHRLLTKKSGVIHNMVLLQMFLPRNILWAAPLLTWLFVSHGKFAYHRLISQIKHDSG